MTGLLSLSIAQGNSKKMRGICFAFLIFASVSSLWALDPIFYDLGDAPYLFGKFIVDHNRHYGSDTELYVRYDLFKNSLKEINHLNSNRQSPVSAVFAINQFSDYTQEELKKLNGVLHSPERQARQY